MDLASNGGTIGNSGNPGWLTLNVVAGGLTLNNGANIYGYVTISDGVLAINGNTLIVGGVAANQLLIKNNGKLCLSQSAQLEISLRFPPKGRPFNGPAGILQHDSIAIRVFHMCFRGGPNKGCTI